MKKSSTAFVGMDVHKESIEIEIADEHEACDEAIRNVVRAREDCVRVQRQARQRLQAPLLRNGIRYEGKTAWTKAHRRWIARLKLPHPAQQIAFEEYVATIEQEGQRLERLAQASPRRLMGYLGMIPSENSSGARHRQGTITKAGNGSAPDTMPVPRRDAAHHAPWPAGTCFQASSVGDSNPRTPQELNCQTEILWKPIA